MNATIKPRVRAVPWLGAASRAHSDEKCDQTSASGVQRHWRLFDEVTG